MKPPASTPPPKSAPPARAARLVVRGGLSHGALRSEDGLPTLCRVAASGKHAPTLVEEADTVLVHGGHGWPWQRKRATELVLAAGLDWAIEVRGGVADVTGDLSRVRLTSLTVDGGSQSVSLALGDPRGTTALDLTGGVHGLVVTRPPGVGVRVVIRGGAQNLAVDEFFFGGVGGPVRLETTEYRTATARYDLTIGGGAHGVKITRADA